MSKQREHADFVNMWNQELKAAAEYREKNTTYNRWPDYRKYYRGDWAPGIVPVNRIFSLGRTLIPKIYFQSPRVTVTARRPEFVYQAKVVEEIDNLLIRETLLKGSLKRCILNSFICGYAPIKLGFDSEFGFVPDLAMGDDFESESQIAKKQNRLIEYNESVKPGMPWALPAAPEDVLIPPGAYSTDALPWVAHRVIRLLEDVQQDSKYSNTAGLQGTRYVPGKPFINKQMQLFDPNTHEAITGKRYCELWEIRDMRTKHIHTICEDQILLSIPDALQSLAGSTWDFLVFNEDPEHLMGISDIHIVEAQQLELNEIRTQASKHRKIALLKFLYKVGAIKNLDAFFSGEVGPGVPVDDEVVSAAVHMLQPHIPPDLRTEAMLTGSDMRESLGYSENEMGAFSPYHGKTATETMQVAQSNDSRVNERKDMVADLLVRIVNKWNKYIFKLWTKERVVPIIGPQGAEEWIRFTGDQLQGEYMLHVDPESGFPVNKATKMQISNQLLQFYGGDPQIYNEMLKKRHLEQYEWCLPGISNLVKMMPPQQGDAMAQDRQPQPMGAGQSASTSNSPGRRAGSVLEFDKAKQRHEETTK